MFTCPKRVRVPSRYLSWAEFFSLLPFHNFAQLIKHHSFAFPFARKNEVVFALITVSRFECAHYNIRIYSLKRNMSTHIHHHQDKLATAPQPDAFWFLRPPLCQMWGVDRIFVISCGPSDSWLQFNKRATWMVASELFLKNIWNNTVSCLRRKYRHSFVFCPSYCTIFFLMLMCYQKTNYI